MRVQESKAQDDDDVFNTVKNQIKNLKKQIDQESNEENKGRLNQELEKKRGKISNEEFEKINTSYKDHLRQKIENPNISKTDKQSLLEKYNKSYIATVLTQPLYVVIDLFGIIKCLFSDKEERQKLLSLIVKYFRDHKYALLVIASLSTYLYFWFRDKSIQLDPNVLSKTLIPRDTL